MSKKGKTVTRSFRISESALQALEEDAASKKVSLNTLVNQLLLTHANFGRVYDRLGVIRISVASFNRLLNACPDEALIENAKLSGKDTPKAIILAKHGVLSLTTVLDFVRGWAEYGHLTVYSDVETQGKRVITLMHNHGQKGSTYLRYYFESVFELIGRQPKITATEHSIAIEI